MNIWALIRQPLHFVKQACHDGWVFVFSKYKMETTLLRIFTYTNIHISLINIIVGVTPKENLTPRKDYNRELESFK